MDLIIDIILIVFGILWLILFFKFWGATNDIRKIRNEVCKTSQVQEEKPKAPEVRKPATSTPKGNSFNVGDWVTIKDSPDRVMYIDRINNLGEFVCKTTEGEIAGTFRESQLLHERY